MQCHPTITRIEEPLQSTQMVETCNEISSCARVSDRGAAVGKSRVHSAPSSSSTARAEEDLINGNGRNQNNHQNVSDGVELADFIVDMVHKSRVTNQDVCSQNTDKSQPEPPLYLSSADTSSEIVDLMWLSGFREDSSAETLAQEMHSQLDPSANSGRCTSEETLTPTISEISNVPVNSTTLDQREEVENVMISDGVLRQFKETPSDDDRSVHMERIFGAGNDLIKYFDNRELESSFNDKDIKAEMTAQIGNGGVSDIPEKGLYQNTSHKSARYTLVKENDRLYVPDNRDTSVYLNVELAATGTPFHRSRLSSDAALLITDSSRNQISMKEDLRSSINLATQLHGEHHFEAYLSAYNQFIRSKRLTEALELLEDEDRKGILNMDKIYHTRFYQVCKDKKAVKEAFRFTKLVKSPTLSTFNMLLSVCANAADVKGAFHVLSAVQKAGLKADCALYTNLISTCAKAGKVDLVFKVFHEMESFGVKANVHTYAAMIDSCARTGQVAKAFGFYQIMTSKNIRADRVIFNSLINACGRSGALERAFSVLSKMKTENVPVEPDHVTMGSLIDACSRVGEVERALDVYNTMKGMGIKGSTEAYTTAIHACSQNKNLEIAIQIYADMKKDGVKPDEVFFSALIDVAGSTGQVEAAFDVLKEMQSVSIVPGVVVYSALMGVCSKTENWEMALELYQEMRASALVPTVSTFNALLTALCNAKQLRRSLDVFQEMKQTDSVPNEITYTILLKACEKEDDADAGFQLYLRATSKGVIPNVQICSSIIGLCLKRIRKNAPPPPYACPLGPLHTVTGKEEAHEQWASWALAAYRQTISASAVPTIKLFSRLLGCLRIPVIMPPKGLYANGGIFSASGMQSSSKHSMMEGFGMYDPRALTLYEEASALGVVPHFSYTNGPIILDAQTMPSFAAEVCVLTILKGLKHRHAAGARLPSVIIKLDVDGMTLVTPSGNTKLVSTCSRTGQAIHALLKRLKLLHNGYASAGRLRITGKAVEKWLKPSKEETIKPFLQLQESLALSSVLGKGILEQQRAIRMAEISRSALDVRPVLSRNGASMDETEINKSKTTREVTSAEITHNNTGDKSP
ncbi:hypothetical protein O6H91_07G059700 [Diphasiastrum complanatum]|nr:hypothetical protein O6H91_07G059700 [Diphasiastrum complanatum]